MYLNYDYLIIMVHNNKGKKRGPEVARVRKHFRIREVELWYGRKMWYLGRKLEN